MPATGRRLFLREQMVIYLLIISFAAGAGMLRQQSMLATIISEAQKLQCISGFTVKCPICLTTGPIAQCDIQQRIVQLVNGVGLGGSFKRHHPISPRFTHQTNHGT